LARLAGIVAPAAAPPAVVDRLAAEMQRIQATADFRDQLLRFGMEPMPPNTPQEFAAIIRAEQPRWLRPSRIPARKSIEERFMASPVIDVHTHCLTEAWFDLLKQHGGPRYSVKAWQAECGRFISTARRS
jgi:hypothetical protein